MRAAEQECRNRNHYYVGVEHMLLALLEERDPSVEARLGEQGVGGEAIRAELRRVLGTGEDRSWDGILLTPRVRAVIRSAEEIAGETAVEPLHLFAAIHNDNGTAAELLRKGRGPAGEA